jgi:hypothetical protein
MLSSCKGPESPGDFFLSAMLASDEFKRTVGRKNDDTQEDRYA